MQVGQGAGPCKIRRAYCPFETSTTGRRLSHAGGAVSGLAMSSAVALVLPRLSLATYVERPCVFLILSSEMQNHHLLCFRSVFFHGTFLHMRLSQACVAAIVVLDRLCSRPDRVLSSCLLAMHKKLCIIFLYVLPCTQDRKPPLPHSTYKSSWDAVRYLLPEYLLLRKSVQM